MAGTWYVGRTPDSDSDEIPKSFADAQIAAGIPTVTSVRAKIAAAVTANSLVIPAYVNQSNAPVAKKTAVDTADQLYVPTSALGAAKGVASLDSNGNLVTAQVPSGIPTEYQAVAYDVATAGTVLLTTAQTVLTSNLRELKIASIPIADPGYPWRPEAHALVQGGDPGASAVPGSRLGGTSSYGLLSVMPPQGVSDQVYGAGICTDTYSMNFYECLPYAAAGQTPQSVPPITGPLELDLYGSVWTGASFQFTPVGLMYWVLVLPAM